MKLEAYHTQAHNKGILNFPELAEGADQWLGDGFYFWQDFQFTEWWGDNKKCKYWNKSKRYDIYKAELEFEPDDFIDTVFNEVDYYYFVNNIEKFSKSFQKKFRKKPTLEEFNLFIKNFKVWDNIKIIRFQDVPENDYLVEVKGFYYKKRIQIRVNKPTIISNFVHLITKDCIK
jgi:hypothetical protein